VAEDGVAAASGRRRTGADPEAQGPSSALAGIQTKEGGARDCGNDPADRPCRAARQGRGVSNERASSGVAVDDAAKGPAATTCSEQ